MRLGILTVIGCALLVSSAQAQNQIPPPAGPVTICGTQAAPAADSYELVFDGGIPEPVTVAAASPACPAGSTHSFSLPAARFTVGQHTLRLRAINAFGATDGATYALTVGIAPGPFTVTAVVVP